MPPGALRPRRAERRADLVVAEVVPVAEDDRGALCRRQLLCEVLELEVGGPGVLDGGLLLAK